ncbi:MAG TPA: ABC transporter permease [Candidatus Sulfotelmatobacter sp.]|nr:ABC transporter permease [Candidatus Sulfotelmatobacter sp.]
MLREFLTRLRFFLSRKRPVDLDDELQFHLEQSTQTNIAAGMSPEEARRQAGIAFGGVERTREQCYEQRPGRLLEAVVQDVRYALRWLGRNPIFTTAVITTLALGIGATTAVFSVVDSLLLRPLPYPNSEQIVRIWNTFSPRGMNEIPLSEPEFLEYQQSQSFAHVAGFSLGTVTLTGTGDPLRLVASWGTSEFFSVLGTEPFLGRVFSTQEQQAGHTQVVVLSYKLWQNRFGSNPEIVGSSVLLNGDSSVVVGVMPRDFKFPSEDVDVWQPLAISPASSNLGNHYLNLVGDLKQATLDQARAEMKTILVRIEEKYPSYYNGAAGIGVALIPLREQMTGSVRTTLLVLMAAVCFMLLIACTNVSNLLLAKAEDRKKEIATRTALGASRWRIIRQVLIENLLLFLASGIAGLLLAFFCLKILPFGDSVNVAQFGGVALNLRVLAFAAILCLFTGLLFGLVPALKASHSDFNDTLKTSGRNSGGSRRGTRHRSLLVISEIAFSLVLLAGAGLMIGSLVRLLGVTLGFDPKNVVTMRLSLPQARYSLGRTATFYQQLQEQVRSLPGVEAVAIVNQLPLSNTSANSSLEVEGRPAGTDINVADSQIISPDYFRAMGIPLVRGRFLSEADTRPAPMSVMVNQTLARKVWPGENPIGKRIRFRSDAPWLSVIGVVTDIKNHGSNVATKPEVYFLHTDQPSGLWADFRSMTLIVRTAGGPQQTVGAIRGELKNLDPDLPIYKVQTLDQIVSASVSQTRFPALLLSVFAGLALLLAAVGVYGVLAYTVEQSKHEIGVRMALGAPRAQILRLFLGQGVKWAMLGGGAGLLAAFILVRFMRSMLFEVGAYDPGIFASGVAMLTIVVLMACYLPALRATKIDPMAAVRSE